MTTASFDYQLLTEIRTIGSSITNVFVNNPLKKQYIRSITLYNGHTEAVNVKLYKVPQSGGNIGVAAISNQFFGNNIPGETNMEAGDTIIIEYPIPGKILTSLNDSIQAIASVGNVVTIEIEGANE